MSGAPAQGHMPPGTDFTSLSSDIGKLRLPGLKTLCKALGISIKGRKQDIVDRVFQLVDPLVISHSTSELMALRLLLLKLDHNDPLPQFHQLVATIRANPLVFDRMRSSMNQFVPITDSTMRYRALNGSAPLPGRSGPVHSTHNGQHLPHDERYFGPMLMFKSTLFYTLRLAVGGVHVLVPSKIRNTKEFMVQLKGHELSLLNSSPRMKLFVFGGPESTVDKSDTPISFPLIEFHVNKVVTKQNARGIKGRPGTARPADLTPYLRSAGKPNHISIVYSDAQEKYLLYTYIVEEYTPEELVEAISKKPHIPLESTKRAIHIDHQMGDDDDIVVGTVSLSLRCPLTYTRIVHPMKSTSCDHIQCFDGLSFLIMQSRIPAWQCPVCSKYFDQYSLAVCDYTRQILDSTPDNVDKVVLKADGSWEAEVESDDDDSRSSSPEPRQTQGTKQESVDHSIEIISLDSESEDEAPPQRVPATQPAPAPQPALAPQSAPAPQSASPSSLTAQPQGQAQPQAQSPPSSVQMQPQTQAEYSQVQPQTAVASHASSPGAQDQPMSNFPKPANIQAARKPTAFTGTSQPFTDAAARTSTPDSISSNTLNAFRLVENQTPAADRGVSQRQSETTSVADDQTRTMHQQSSKSPHSVPSNTQQTEAPQSSAHPAGHQPLPHRNTQHATPAPNMEYDDFVLSAIPRQSPQNSLSSSNRSQTHSQSKTAAQAQPSKAVERRQARPVIEPLDDELSSANASSGSASPGVFNSGAASSNISSERTAISLAVAPIVSAPALGPDAVGPPTTRPASNAATLLAGHAVETRPANATSNAAPAAATWKTAPSVSAGSVIRNDASSSLINAGRGSQEWQPSNPTPATSNGSSNVSSSNAASPPMAPANNGSRDKSSSGASPTNATSASAASSDTNGSHPSQDVAAVAASSKNQRPQLPALGMSSVSDTTQRAVPTQPKSVGSSERERSFATPQQGSPWGAQQQASREPKQTSQRVFRAGSDTVLGLDTTGKPVEPITRSATESVVPTTQARPDPLSAFTNPTRMAGNQQTAQQTRTPSTQSVDRSQADRSQSANSPQTKTIRLSSPVGTTLHVPLSQNKSNTALSPTVGEFERSTGQHVSLINAIQDQVRGSVSPTVADGSTGRPSVAGPNVLNTGPLQDVNQQTSQARAGFQSSNGINQAEYQSDRGNYSAGEPRNLTQGSSRLSSLWSNANASPVGPDSRSQMVGSASMAASRPSSFRDARKSVEKSNVPFSPVFDQRVQGVYQASPPVANLGQSTAPSVSGVSHSGPRHEASGWSAAPSLHAERRGLVPAGPSGQNSSFPSGTGVNHQQNAFFDSSAHEQRPVDRNEGQTSLVNASRNSSSQATQGHSFFQPARNQPHRPFVPTQSPTSMQEHPSRTPSTGSHSPPISDSSNTGSSGQYSPGTDEDMARFILNGLLQRPSTKDTDPSSSVERLKHYLNNQKRTSSSNYSDLVSHSSRLINEYIRKQYAASAAPAKTSPQIVFPNLARNTSFEQARINRESNMGPASRHSPTADTTSATPPKAPEIASNSTSAQPAAKVQTGSNSRTITSSEWRQSFINQQNARAASGAENGESSGIATVSRGTPVVGGETASKAPEAQTSTGNSGTAALKSNASQNIDQKVSQPAENVASASIPETTPIQSMDQLESSKSNEGVVSAAIPKTTTNSNPSVDQSSNSAERNDFAASSRPTANSDKNVGQREASKSTENDSSAVISKPTTSSSQINQKEVSKPTESVASAASSRRATVAHESADVGAEKPTEEAVAPASPTSATALNQHSAQNEVTDRASTAPTQDPAGAKNSSEATAITGKGSSEISTKANEMVVDKTLAVDETSLSKDAPVTSNETAQSQTAQNQSGGNANELRYSRSAFDLLGDVGQKTVTGILGLELLEEAFSTRPNSPFHAEDGGAGPEKNSEAQQPRDKANTPIDVDMTGNSTLNHLDNELTQMALQTPQKRPNPEPGHTWNKRASYGHKSKFDPSTVNQADIIELD